MVEEEDEDDASSLTESFASRPSSSLLSPLTAPVTLRRGDDGSGPVADMIAVVVASRGRVCESMLLYSLYSIVLLPRPPEDWLTRYIAGAPPPPPRQQQYSVARGAVLLPDPFRCCCCFCCLLEWTKQERTRFKKEGGQAVGSVVVDVVVPLRQERPDLRQNFREDARALYRPCYSSLFTGSCLFALPCLALPAVLGSHAMAAALLWY